MKKLSNRGAWAGFLPVLVFAWGALSTALIACPYSIRDAAFIGGGAASRYRLNFLFNSDAPGSSVSAEQLAEWLSVGASAWFEDANVEAGVLDLADPRAREQVPEDFSVPAELPAAILVSPANRAMVLPDVDSRGAGARPPASAGHTARKLSLDSVMGTALRVIESPLRRGIHDRLVKSWCVVLVVEGTSKAQNARAKKAVGDAAKSITGQATEMGKVVTEGPALLTVSYRDPAEQIVLWSLGLQHAEAKAGEKAEAKAGEKAGENSDADVPVRVVMLVGRGERRGPLLEGDAVTAKKLLEMFTMLGRSCSCTTAEMWLSGPSLPLEWTAETEDAVEIELGFDPQNPAALGAIKGVLEGASISQPFSEAALGYSEIVLETYSGDAEADESISDLIAAEMLAADEGQASSAEESSDDSEQVVSAPPPPEPSRVGHGALMAIFGVAFLVFVAATVIVVRRSSRNA